MKNICDDTTLTKKQQLKSIQTLKDLQLLDVKLDYDNTRFFCINVESLIDYEKIDIKKLLKKNESKKSSQVKSKKGAQSENPFSQKESKKSSLCESTKTPELESQNTPQEKEKNDISRTVFRE